jgi:hypothetical protein
MLLMLEDDVERVNRFKEVVRAIDPNLQLMIWRNAKVMVHEIGTYLPNAKLISLDHDLEPDKDGSDPGDGLEVVKFLVSQPVIRPVIIHSSNSDRSIWMEGEFELAGWQCWKVAPLGEDWVEVDWRRVARRLLRKANRNRS